MTKGKITLIQKDPLKELPEQLQTYNMPTNEVENNNGTY